MQKQKEKNYKYRSRKIIDINNLQVLSKKLRKTGKKIVFTTGTFDLLNPGHCRYLSEAKAKGDILVVGITSDISETRQKGEGYPLIGQEIRAEVVSHLRDVDYVTIIDEDRPHGALIFLQPHMFFTSNGLNEKFLSQEKSILKLFGGKLVKREKHLPYFSSQLLVEHIANIRVTKILEKYIQEKVADFKWDPLVHFKPADFGDQHPNDMKAYDANKDIIYLKDLEEYGNKMRSRGKKIVFVSGSYDLLHVGHARFIEQGAILGDVLVIGIPSDQKLRKLKGEGRPVISEKARAYVLCHLDYTDKVVIFDDSSVLSSLQALKPDIFFTVEEDWNKEYKKSPEFKLVTSYGGKVVRLGRQSPFLSASMIIDKVAQKKVRDIFKECMKEELYEKVLTEKV